VFLWVARAKPALGSEVKTMLWRRIGTGCLAACVAVGVVGCVSLPDYERVKRARDTATEINESLERRADQLEQELDDLKAEMRTYRDLKSQMDGKDQQVAQLRAALQEALQRGSTLLPWPAGSTGDFEVNPDTGGIVLPGDVLFDSGKATIKEGMKGAIKKLAELIKEKDPEERYVISVDGFTDRVPVERTRKENIDNWYLGARRAHAVMFFLYDQCGIPRERFRLTSSGYRHEREKVRKSARNRRVEIRLVMERAVAPTEEGK
jgi:chemotaxis protein MotB